MIDIGLQTKTGYKYLGYENGWPFNLEGNRMKVTEPLEVIRCKEQEHQLNSYSTRRGEHHYWCDICKIEWFLDSGD